MLNDTFGRTMSYLRMSVTDQCNFRCMYCKPSRDYKALQHADILSFEELLRMAKVGAGLGISKVRITGGEPLVRRGIMEFVERLAAVEGLDDISITTNGVLLERNLERLWACGVRRLNISLDTLKPERFKRITGFDQFETVWSSIERAMEMGFAPVKINMVVIPGVNEDEVQDMAMLAKRYPLHVRFIEYMPMNSGTQVQAGWDALGQHARSAEAHLRRGASIDAVKKRVAELGGLIPVMKSHNGGPAERFRFADAAHGAYGVGEGCNARDIPRAGDNNEAGEVGFIGSMSHKFCATCNRLRLTADGHLRACLLSDRQVDVKGPLRDGATDTELASLYAEIVRNKPQNHALDEGAEQQVQGQMHAIGG